MKLIEEKELANLILDSYRLACLEESGVDNWEWYGEAFDTEMSETAKYYKQLREMSDEEIVKEYETFNKNNK